MAIRSREFVGIAEGIKSHELSAKSKIESLKGTVSDLSSRRFGLNHEISSLEAELAAAYEDTDEDDEPNYALIDAIESQIASAENELSEVENELDDANSELSQSEMELAAVMEEKAQTLFEIQERARKTSQNIATVGGMYGAYMGVGNTLQNSMQTSLASLSQAASILDGSVDGSSSGGAGGGQGRTASGGGSSAPSDLSTSALSAFSGGGADSSFSAGFSPSNFSTNHSSGVTPASTHNFGGSQSINPQKTINFNSGQSEGSAASSAFTCIDEDDDAAVAANYTSEQKSSGQDTNFAQTRSDLKQRRSWLQQYRVGFTPTATETTKTSSQNAGAPQKDARELADELDYELSFGTLLSKIRGKKESAKPTQSTYDSDISQKRENDFLQSLKVKVNPIIIDVKNTSSNDSDDDVPNIGARIKQHDEWDFDREQYLSSLKDKFASFLHRNTNDNFEHSENALGKAQTMIDNYCKKTLGSILPNTKQGLKLSDSVEFQDAAEFGFRFTVRYSEDPSGVNGYFDRSTQKSYVNNNGPHPVKTAIHEQNHLLSCKKDSNGKVIATGVVTYERDNSGEIVTKNLQVNEALTEYFTKKMMGNQYPSNPQVGYIYNMMRIEKMEAGFGYDTLKKAYYLNQPNLLKEKYESVMGGNKKWESFAKSLDDSLREYTQEEINAIRDYYQKTGKRLFTETDKIRQEAADYANKCATEFAMRSRGEI